MAVSTLPETAELELENERLARANEELERVNALLREQEEELRRSEELYRRAIVQAGAVPYVLDYSGPGGGEYTFMGEHIVDLTGYTADEITPSVWRDAIVKEFVTLGDQSGLPEADALRRTRAGEFVRWRCDYRIATRDGEEKWISDASVEIVDEEGTPMGSIGILQDVTERRNIERELERLAAILEATTDAVGMADPRGRMLYLNRAGRTLLGIGEHEVLSDARTRDFYAPSVVEHVLGEGVETAIREGVWTAETLLRSRDGREIPVSQVVIAHKRPDGSVAFFSTIARDVSERKELEAQLRQAQKLEAVGRLAGGVAHDFNNLLTAIGGYSMLLLERLEHGNPLREQVEEIAKAGQLGAALTQQLLVFSRRQVLSPRVLDLNAVVIDVQTLLRRLIREDIELVTRLAQEPLRVSADPGQLSQVLVNLVVNAEDAMSAGGRLAIETACADLDEEYVRGHVVARAGPYARLTVTDTGAGMDEETRSQMFEPFFTTKPRGKGTGLGLATVFGIVEQSGGHIFVYSEPGQGTSVKVYLPRVDDVALPTGTAADEDALAGTEVVLLVEDEPAVRSFARDVLRTRGYTVVEAADGEEALKLVADWEGPLDVLVTDLVMPGMSGRELAERVSENFPELRVLFISGYTEDAIFRFGALAPGQAFLQKPFTPRILAREVRGVLDG
jgi:PAS domain S-box-containing protein